MHLKERKWPEVGVERLISELLIIVDGESEDIWMIPRSCSFNGKDKTSWYDFDDCPGRDIVIRHHASIFGGVYVTSGSENSKVIKAHDVIDVK